MTVITISRQFGSGGDEIAARVCRSLGYQHFDKRMIAQAASEVGLSEQEVIDYSEDNHKVQSFLERLLNRQNIVGKTRIWKEAPSGTRTAEEFTFNEDTAVALVQKAIRSAYQAGNIVIIGRGGQILLKDHPKALHVRVVAPLEDRIQRVRTQMKHSRQAYLADIDLRREAQDWIIERDEASADYIKRFYQADWEDPLLYHLVINTGRISIEQSVELILRLSSGTEIRAIGTEEVPAPGA